MHRTLEATKLLLIEAISPSKLSRRRETWAVQAEANCQRESPMESEERLPTSYFSKIIEPKICLRSEATSEDNLEEKSEEEANSDRSFYKESEV